MSEKKILVTKSSMPEYEEYIEEIKDIWDSHWMTNMGPKHQQLQKQLKEYLGVGNVELLTNGHMALELTMQALGLKGEVITTPFTFASTTQSIVRNGLTPVFCDISPVDFTIDADKIESLITEKTTAIVPVHVYGNVCNVEKIDEIAKKHNLKVVYDAAHTFGVKYKNKGIASFGDVSCFSFHATKVFNTIEGGAVCFNDEEFGVKIKRLKNFGIKDGKSIVDIGGNAKMNEFCAAMGLCNLRHVDEEISKRKKVAKRYKENLANIKGLYLMPDQKDVEQNYAYLPVVFDENAFGKNRDEVLDVLGKNNINARKYFYPATNEFECYQGLFEIQNTPVAHSVSRNILCLPLYADLSLDDVDRICEIIIDFRK